MRKVNEVIIVEGKHDIAFLKSFIEADFIETSGTNIPSSTLELINTYKEQGRSFIILTDPDYPGSYIRNKLLEIIPNAKVGFVNKEDAKTDKKVGIEHSTKDIILDCLENLISYTEYQESITIDDLFEYHLTGYDKSQQLRDTVSNYYKIGHCNTKQFLKRINSLNLKRGEILDTFSKLL